MKIYRCKRCNYVYVDEEQEIPFEKVTKEWKCPKCRSSKNFFVEKANPKKELT
jgi:rubredoxin